VRLTVDRKGEVETLHADCIVIAIRGNRVLSLFEQPREARRNFFPHMAYTSIATQFHIFQHDPFDPKVAPADGVMIPRSYRNIRVSFIYFQQRQDSRWLALTEPRAGSYNPAEPEEVQLERAWQEVTKVYPELINRRLASRQFRWLEKVPAFRVGYLDAVR
jgi:protoporphyrinogen oxidase